jgi:uncharacterized protein (UPF0264 family)
VKGYDAKKKVVASGYSDFHRVGSVDPMLLHDVASLAGADVVMVDTAVKDGRSTFEFMNEEQLVDFVRNGRAAGLEVALAGTIGFEHLQMLKRIDPDIIGVRGIVCGGDRSCALQETLVRKLRSMVA